MIEHTPDNWVILKIDNDNETFYKVLAGWSGGYLTSDSWSLNSGITEIKEQDDYYLIYGYSGSIYKCHKNSETIRMNCAYVYEQFKNKLKDKINIIPIQDVKI